jgi:hypothetical protein
MAARRTTTEHLQLSSRLASAAKKRQVHLVVSEDDKGDKIVAASKKPFRVIA